jgi:hypothetical protein
MIDKYRDELIADTSEENRFRSEERVEQEKFLSKS